jgi:two-component system OmpR family response regulator
MVSLNYVQPETRRGPRDPQGFLHGISSDTLPARILIVDDDTELRRMVADYLEGQNMRAHSVPKPFGLRELLARMRAVLRRDDLGRPHRSATRWPAGTDSQAGSSTCVRGVSAARMSAARRRQIAPSAAVLFDGGLNQSIFLDPTHPLRKFATGPKSFGSGSHDKSPVVASYPRSEPVSMTRPISSHPARILFVDDDSTLQRMVVNYLEGHNMRVSSVSQPQEAMRRFAAEEPGMVILDLQLGQADGLNVLREIRSRSDVPVIIVTGHRRDEIDRVVGLELGADDYLAKPFGLRELLARIRAVLRRCEAGRIASQRKAEQGRCQFGDWQLDRRARRLTSVGGAPVMLTKGEYALLIAFLDAPQRPLTREHLLQATRIHENVFDRSIDVQILRLRRKLETDPSAPRILQTERGVGYVFTLPVEPL